MQWTYCLLFILPFARANLDIAQLNKWLKQIDPAWIIAEPGKAMTTVIRNNRSGAVLTVFRRPHEMNNDSGKSEGSNLAPNTYCKFMYKPHLCTTPQYTAACFNYCHFRSATVFIRCLCRHSYLNIALSLLCLYCVNERFSFQINL